jgi:hypothetical protein
MPSGFDEERAHESFMQGGYYEHDFDDSQTSLLAMNTIFFKDDNKCKIDKGNQQLDWLDNTLQEAASNGRKYILSMHVFPGINYFNGKEERFWHQDHTDKFL